MSDIPILAPEDKAEQPRQYPVGKPLNALDGYSMVQGTFVNSDMDCPNPKYWIERIQSESCQNHSLYNIRRSPCPNPGEIIMTCSKETVHDSCSSGDKLVFKRKGITRGELHYIVGKKSMDHWSYSLRDQQGELGLIYGYNDNSGRMDYHPFFQLSRINNRSFALLITILGLLLLVLGIYLASSYEEMRVTMSIIFFLIILIFCCYSCFSPSCQEDGVKRLHISNVLDITTRQLVAKVYSLAGTCGNFSNDMEIICHRTVTTAQLMGLISLAMLSTSNKKRDEANQNQNQNNQ